MTQPCPPVRYRRASAADLEAIIELWSGMMAEHSREDPRIRLTAEAPAAYRAYAASHIDQEDSMLEVAEADGRIVGFMLLMISRNLPVFRPSLYGYLSDLAVAPRWRRRGIGRDLVRRGAEWLRRRDIHTIQLQYYEFNRRAGSFWRALGFRPYYTRMWLDLE